MATQPAAEPDGADDLPRAYEFLREQLPLHFNLGQLKDLCGRMGLDYQRAHHDTLDALADDLLRYAANRNLQGQLLAHLRRERDFVPWPANYRYPAGGLPAPVAAPAPEPNHAPRGNGNPFGRTGRLDGPPAYLVRQPFTAQVVDELSKGQSLSIVGESQTGKSSLLWYLAHHAATLLGRRAADCVYLDMQLLGDDHDFFDALGDELGIAAARGYKLSRALRGRNILLCLDEVEKMTWDGFTIDLRGQLRGLADGPDTPLTLVIASRSPLAALFPDAPGLTSPLANLCHRMDMQPFTLAETRELVDTYLRGRRQTLSPEAIEAAWRSSSGSPAWLQGELRAAYDRAFPPRQ